MMMVRSRTLKQKMCGYLAFHQRILKCSKVVTLACIKYNTQQTIRLHIINTTLLWCFVWQNPKSQLKESMSMFLLKLRSLYKCLKLDLKPNVCRDLIRFEFWKVDQSVPVFIVDWTDSSLLIWSSNRKRGNVEIVKRIEGIKSAKLKTGNWIFDIHFFVLPDLKRDKQLDFH